MLLRALPRPWWPWYSPQLETLHTLPGHGSCQLQTSRTETVLWPPQAPFPMRASTSSPCQAAQQNRTALVFLWEYINSGKSHCNIYKTYMQQTRKYYREIKNFKEHFKGETFEDNDFLWNPNRLCILYQYSQFISSICRKIGPTSEILFWYLAK